MGRLGSYWDVGRPCWILGRAEVGCGCRSNYVDGGVPVVRLVPLVCVSRGGDDLDGGWRWFVWEG